MPSLLTKTSEDGSTESLLNKACSSGRSPSPHKAAMEWNLRAFDMRSFPMMRLRHHREAGAASHPITDSQKLALLIDQTERNAALIQIKSCAGHSANPLKSGKTILTRPLGPLR